MKTNRMARNKKIFSICFLSPAFILYTVFIILPILGTLYYSMTKWNMVTDAKFIGFDNFIYLYTRDSSFSTVLKNTFSCIAICLLFEIPLATIFAFLVYRVKRGFRFFQSVYFVPAVISSAVVGLMYSLLFNTELGPINDLLNVIGLGGLRQNWLSDPNIVLYTVIAPTVWQMIGYYLVIILAAMQSISEEVIESAIIDGANSIHLFFQIVVPLVKNIIQVCVVLCITGSLKYFDIPYMMTWGGPGVRSTFLSIYMYKQAFNENRFGRACAVSVNLAMIALIATVLVNLIFNIGEKRKDRYKERI